MVKFQETPNPNAVKCVLDRAVAAERRSFFSAEQAGGDPIASALFAIPGVTNVLMSDDWVTVGTAPGSDWKAVKAGISRVLREAP